MNDICGNVEFGGTKQKIFNAVFSTLVDAYIDRFIIAANISLKLKLFGQVGDIDPQLFTLIGLASQKQSKMEPIDLLATLNDPERFEKFQARIDRDIEHCFLEFSAHSHQGFRVQ